MRLRNLKKMAKPYISRIEILRAKSVNLRCLRIQLFPVAASVTLWEWEFLIAMRLDNGFDSLNFSAHITVFSRWFQSIPSLQKWLCYCSMWHCLINNNESSAIVHGMFSTILTLLYSLNFLGFMFLLDFCPVRKSCRFMADHLRKKNKSAAILPVFPGLTLQVL